AHIRDGLRAISGAIERVFIDGEKIQVQTIQNIPANGICGSGILDAVAEMRKEKLIDARGTFNKSDSRVTARNGILELVLVPVAQSGIQHEIAINRKDINEIQLAKAAIRSGIEVLMKQANIGVGDVDLFLVAGAFGTYLDLKNALRIGMFPCLPVEHFEQVGNAAGSGAREMLVSTHKRLEAEQMIDQAEYIELTTQKDYVDIFMSAISLE
ncbi:MAG: ATP-binding protein, partial [Anaerolineaceae bacterium]|nr:ATP-binding protein [Anaerolineaceae bacterium]